MKFQYGAVSSKYELEAENKLTAYAAMVCHYNRNSHLLVIYEPKDCDSWFAFDGRITKRLDEIFGGEGSFDKYVDSHLEEIKKALDSINQIV